MKDAALHLEINFPAANAAVSTTTLDLGVDVPGFSDNWRTGRLSLTVPALPNHVNPALNITITLQDSGDGGATFANTQPLIQAVIPGVATTGVPAQTIDLPLPPGLRGPVQLQVAVPATDGDNTAATLKADWENQ